MHVTCSTVYWEGVWVSGSLRLAPARIPFFDVFRIGKIVKMHPRFSIKPRAHVSVLGFGAW